MPAIATSCTNAKVTLGNDYYFRTCYLDPFQGAILADWATEQDYNEIATINSIGNEYTSGLVAAFTTQFEKNGGKVVDAETFQSDASDFKTILTNIKTSGVKAVFAPTDYAYAPLLLNQAADLGLKVQWIAGDAWNTPALTSDTGANAEGVILDSAYAEGVDKAFDKGFKEWIQADSSRLEANAGTTSLTGNQALSFDSYNVMLDAIQQADSLDGSAICDALLAMEKTDAVSGTLTFDQDGDAIRNTAYLLEVKDDTFTLADTVTHTS